MLKIVCFWVSIILSLICIIAQNSLLFGLRFYIFCSRYSLDCDETPNIDFLHDFFGTRPQREDKSHTQINIGAFAPMHRFLAKVVVTNLWPQARRSELTLK
jgi:hypothetical protein